MHTFVFMEFITSYKQSDNFSVQSVIIWMPITVLLLLTAGRCPIISLIFIFIHITNKNIDINLITY